jgi:subtilisin-like proprotein convertase family protein
MAMPVGSVAKDGKVASYSTPGASLHVSAPGGDQSEDVSNIMVAAINGKCTDAGQGTSFAAPVVSGVVALMLEANPDLTWRDVQGIIAVTSQRVEDANDYTAAFNGANIWHSNDYGFGVIDAAAAVSAAETWDLYTDEIMRVADSEVLNLEIPDDETQPVTTELVVKDVGSIFIETVYVYLRIEHSSRGDLQVNLTSPSGMVSILSPGRRPENTLIAEDQWWKMTSVRYWGESAEGTWTLSIVDLKEGDVEASCANYEWAMLDEVTCEVLEYGKDYIRERSISCYVTTHVCAWDLLFMFFKLNTAKMARSILTIMLLLQENMILSFLKRSMA